MCFKMKAERSYMLTSLRTSQALSPQKVRRAPPIVSEAALVGHRRRSPTSTSALPQRTFTVDIPTECQRPVFGAGEVLSPPLSQRVPRVILDGGGVPLVFSGLWPRWSFLL